MSTSLSQPVNQIISYPCSRFFFTLLPYALLNLLASSQLLMLEDQGKSTQSAQFLANQRRITVGIIYFGAVELGWVGGPVVIIGSCIIFHIGNYVVSHCSLVLLCFYPISGPYYVLMSNVDYNKRVKEIMKNIRSKLCFSCSNHKVTSVSSAMTVTS
ncbi:unnamed protein product [Auanema sp. JU1783]|nr:unnamed protein product [Auanema sp. JU1783]